MLKGKSLLEDPVATSTAVKTAFLKDDISYYGNQSTKFSYCRGKKDHAIDFIATVKEKLIPFEVKHRTQAAGAGEPQGLLEFYLQKKVKQGYGITTNKNDFSPMPLSKKTSTVKIPARLACYWLEH